MKKLLLASTALVMSAGFAMAEVSVTGNGRMGVKRAPGDSDLSFSSRIRIEFGASKTTESGLEFGGSIRADNASAGNSGTGGSVYLKGGFGTIKMGDVDSGAKAAIGNASGVGYTGLGDLNEISYLNGANDPSLLYQSTFGEVTVYLSAENPNIDGENNAAYGAGVKFSLGDYSAALGYESNEASDTQFGIGLSAKMGSVDLKAIYAQRSFDEAGRDDADQYGLSASFGAGDLATTIFTSEDLDGTRDYGVGFAYDMGGDLALKAGVARDDSKDSDKTGYEIGVTMKF